jgi:NAD(P)-dependent dehydrogenase (short-subunit alcohol dehydrogenase family)
MNRLIRKVALVTGAASGIGEAIARMYAQEGAFVYVTDIEDSRGRRVAEAIGKHAAYARLDVRCEDDWRAVTGQVLEDKGVLHVLVNNAGITGFQDGPVAHDPENASLDDWREVHRTNLDGVFLGCKYAIRAMRRSGAGSIINMSSRSGVVGIPGAAAYASSKAAVRNHTKTVALYCASQGLQIRCNSIHPAAILTPMWEPLLGTGPEREARERMFLEGCPAQRFGTPEEVAAVAVMLASDEVPYMNGAELNVDGGTLAGSAPAAQAPR